MVSFAHLVQDNKYKTDSKKERVGARIFLNRFGRGSRTSDSIASLLKQTNLADSEVSVKQVIQDLKQNPKEYQSAFSAFLACGGGHPYFQLEETRNPRGESKYKLNKVCIVL